MELNEKRQIYIDEAVEEMASAVREITVKCGKCEYYKDGSCLKPIDIGCDINEDILNECDALYNANYRKIADDHARQCTCYALGCQMAEELKSEAARKIVAEIDNALHDMATEYANAGHPEYFAVCEMVHHKVIRPIEKKYTEEEK